MELEPSKVKEYTLTDGTNVKVSYPIRVFIVVDHKKNTPKVGHFSFSMKFIKGNARNVTS